ncbi:hypothetical protein Nepgr_025707 [Nepenthes gracilis]|uniref:Uncharacterized protein n=1 Tax=Nepenthes gracilis TaxID=150966 RepID=A0AAD3Y1B5_NEPGR|nr:hypothetical protein Nepgr_025707 [Nepenthes gracilis]
MQQIRCLVNLFTISWHPLSSEVHEESNFYYSKGNNSSFEVKRAKCSFKCNHQDILQLLQTFLSQMLAFAIAFCNKQLEETTINSKYLCTDSCRSKH